MERRPRRWPLCTDRSENCDLYAHRGMSRPASRTGVRGTRSARRPRCRGRAGPGRRAGCAAGGRRRDMMTISVTKTMMTRISAGQPTPALGIETGDQSPRRRSRPATGSRHQPAPARRRSRGGGWASATRRGLGRRAWSCCTPAGLYVAARPALRPQPASATRGWGVRTPPRRSSTPLSGPSTLTGSLAGQHGIDVRGRGCGPCSERHGGRRRRGTAGPLTSDARSTSAVKGICVLAICIAADDGLVERRRT